MPPKTDGENFSIMSLLPTLTATASSVPGTTMASMAKLLSTTRLEKARTRSLDVENAAESRLSQQRRRRSCSVDVKNNGEGPSLVDLAISHEDLVNRASALRNRLGITPDSNSVCKPKDVSALTANHGRRLRADSGASQASHEMLLHASDVALRSTYPQMEGESLHLLTSLLCAECATNNENQRRDNHTTPWHAALALDRAHSYLDSVEMAIERQENEDNNDKNDRIASIVESVRKSSRDLSMDDAASQKSGVTDPLSDDDDDLDICVSSWALPHLAWDVIVGKSVLTDASTLEKGKVRGAFVDVPMAVEKILPIQLEVRAVVPVFDGSSRTECEACQVTIKRCKHTAASAGSNGWSPFFTPGGATAGNVALLVSVECDGRPVKIHQATVVQANAVPPRPNTAVDMFTSTMDGENDMSVALRFQTGKTSNMDEPANVRVDLIVSLK